MGAPPTRVIPGQYALWRTDTLNVSIRRLPGPSGQLRHLGWEDDSAPTFSQSTDTNGIVWERFSPQQDDEIEAVWPST